MTSGGAVVGAHGTLTNQDTQSYNLNLQPLAPGSGMVTIYAVLSPIKIQQNPVPIPGPPPGHPSFNPNFQPTIGYATSVDSLALTATLTPPDNLTSFELFRVVNFSSGGFGHSAGAAITTANQVRASIPLTRPLLRVNSSTGLTAAQIARYLIAPGPSGLTTILPPASLCVGLVALLLNGTPGWTIAAAGSDQIYANRNSGGSAAFTLALNGATALWCDGINWFSIAVNAAQYTSLLPTGALLGFNGSDVIATGIGTGLRVAGGVLSVPMLPPPTAPLLSGGNAGFIPVNIGTGLQLSGGTLSAPIPAPVLPVPPAAVVLGSENGSTFVSYKLGNGLAYDGSGNLAVPNLIPSSNDDTFLGANAVALNIDNSTDGASTSLGTLNCRFPVSSPTGSFRLFLFGKINWSGFISVGGNATFTAGLNLIITNSASRNVLITGVQQQIILVAGQVQNSNIFISDFDSNTYAPGTNLELTLTALATSPNASFISLQGIGQLRFTTIAA